MQYVYVLRSVEGAQYIGCTKNLSTRLLYHNAGQVISTAKNSGWSCIFYAAFKNVSKAFLFEKYLKSGSGRAFLKKRFLS